RCRIVIEWRQGDRASAFRNDRARAGNEGGVRCGKTDCARTAAGYRRPGGAPLSPDCGPATYNSNASDRQTFPGTLLRRATRNRSLDKAETARSPYCIGIGGGDPSRIRTCNPRSRNPLLYPVELWDRPGGTRPGYPLCIGFPYLALDSTANMKNPLPRQDGRTDFLKSATKAD